MSLDALSLLAQAAEPPPSGGAETGEAIIATGGAIVLTALMLAVVVGHRSGRLAFPGRLAAFSERVSGIPGWASLPLAFVAGSLLVAVFGMYWDISIHIDEGRDPGPLANAAHYFIVLGLFGIMFAGALAIALPKERPSRSAVRISGDWHAPLGGVLIFICSAFALTGFPLDDVWHRIFGQDVTLWGPTHLMLIGGASLATLGAAILLMEGLRERERQDSPRPLHFKRFNQALAAGGFLIGLSTFQAEFDFSVPQFGLLFHPILLMIAAGIGLVAARLMIGRGGALMAVAFYLAVRGFLSITVGPVLGHTTLHMPLYIVEALAVEAVAARMGTRRPVLFGAWAGVGIGTFGLAAEWGWSHLWMTMSWPAALLPEGAILGFAAAVAGGVLGGFAGGALASSEERMLPAPRFAVPAAALALVAIIAYALPISAGPPVRATVALQDVQAPPERTVRAEVRLDPPDAADDAMWFNATAWQGGGSVVDNLEEASPGVWRTTEPIPVHGNWKATLRLHKDDAIAGLPIFLPEDPAIPAKETPASASFSRDFVLDKENLQREQKDDVPGGLTLFAYLTVLAIALGLIASLAVGLRRFERTRAPAPAAGRADQASMVDMSA